jgi:hypothetical protein
MTKKEQPINTIGFQEQLIEAIMNHDISFIEDNIKRINFGEVNTHLFKWRENSIFLSLISSGFTEGFKLIFDNYISQREFVPFDDYHFNYILIQICHYAEKDMLKYVYEKKEFDLTSHDKDGLGLIHYLFDSFADDMGLIEDDKISEFCFYLNENGVNIFEIYPRNDDLSEGLNRSVTRRYFHSIFSYLIISGRFKGAFQILPLIKNEKIISNNSKILEVIPFLHRSLILQSLEKDPRSKPDNFNSPGYRENFPQIDLDYNSKLFSHFLTHFTNLTLDSLYSGNFLFNTSDFKHFYYLDENIKNILIDMFLEKDRVNESLYSALSHIIFKHFGTIEFFNFKDTITSLGYSLSEFLEKEENLYLNDLVSAFQSQKRPPNTKILNMQIDFIKSIKSELMNKKREDKANFSYTDFINFTISDWQDQGFNVELISVEEK